MEDIQSTLISGGIFILLLFLFAIIGFIFYYRNRINKTPDKTIAPPDTSKEFESSKDSEDIGDDNE